MKRSREVAAVVVLLGAVVVQLALGVTSDGLTNDEVIYVPTGLEQLHGDYRTNPTHPPVAKMLVAAGLVGLDVRLPEKRAGEAEITWAHRFFHEENDAGRILRRARVPVAVLTLGLALLVWRWSRRLYGPGPALVALLLFAFHPSLLAHGHLATTDMAGAFAATWAAWAFCAWLERPSLGRALTCGLALGATAATRFTGAFVVPGLLAAGAVQLAASAPAARRDLVRRGLVLAAVSLAAVVVVIWGAYGFRYAPWPGDSVARGDGMPAGLLGPPLSWAQEHHLLPEAYLEAIRYQSSHNATGHPSYLLGHHSKTGWPSYYVVAFAAKNTPGFLLAAAAGAFAFVARLGRRTPRAVPWLCAVSVAAVFLGASGGRIQIGERYLLPAYPFLILLAAGAWSLIRSAAWKRLATGILVLLHVVPALVVVPRGYLAYFNPLTGGPGGGHRVLLDSNLDWGQDLPRLASWMRDHGVARVQLAYHGADVPDRFGIAHEDLPGIHGYVGQAPAQPFTGVVVVSPNLLFGLVPRLGDPYAGLRERRPDGRAGVFFVYRMGHGPR